MALDGRNADLPYILADYHLMIMPEDADPAAPIGTGAFVIEVRAGRALVRVRNATTWKRGGPRRQCRAARHQRSDRAHQRGSDRPGDFVNRVDPKTFVAARERARAHALRVPSAGHYSFLMRCDTPPFDNVDLRLALKYAINRNDMVYKILRG